jgi:hypothetical protein
MQYKQGYPRTKMISNCGFLPIPPVKPIILSYQILKIIQEKSDLGFVSI